MRRTLLLFSLLCALVGLTAARTVPVDYGFGGLFTASDAFVATGTGSTTLAGDKSQYDKNGVTGGFPTTDAAAALMRLLGKSASPIATGGNQTGGDLHIAGGEGTTSVTIDDNAACGAGDTVTLTVSDDATPNVCTRDATTTAAVAAHAGTFVCGANAQATAANIATCLNGVVGIKACGGTACADFTGVSGTVYVYRDSADPSVTAFTLARSDSTFMVTLTNGTMGSVILRTASAVDTTPELKVAPTAITTTVPVLLPAGTASAPGEGWSADADGTGTGWYRPAADQIAATTGGTAKFGIGQANTDICIGGVSSSFPGFISNGGTEMIARQCTTTTRAGIVAAHLQAQAGSAGAPGIRVTTVESTTGWYSTGAGNMSGSVQSTQVVSASTVTWNHKVPMVDTVDSRTIASTGDANPATLTLLPTTSYVEITCNDADTCDITMSETTPTVGQAVVICNISTNVVDFADTAGVSELAGAFAAGIEDCITLRYGTTTWREVARSNN